MWKGVWLVLSLEIAKLTPFGEDLVLERESRFLLK